MIFFHLKNCLFSPFPCRARHCPTPPGMQFILPPCVAISRGTVAPLRLFLKALPAFCTDFIRNFCAFIQPLPPQCTEFPPAFCIKQRIKHTSFLFVQCPEALHVSSAQAVKRLPLGTRGALGAYDFIRTPRFRPGRWRRSFRPRRRRRSRDLPSRS